MHAACLLCLHSISSDATRTDEPWRSCTLIKCIHAESEVFKSGRSPSFPSAERLTGAGWLWPTYILPWPTCEAFPVCNTNTEVTANWASGCVTGLLQANVWRQRIIWLSAVCFSNVTTNKLKYINHKFSLTLLRTLSMNIRIIGLTLHNKSTTEQKQKLCLSSASCGGSSGAVSIADNDPRLCWMTQEGNCNVSHLPVSINDWEPQRRNQNKAVERTTGRYCFKLEVKLQAGRRRDVWMMKQDRLWPVSPRY